MIIFSVSAEEADLLDAITELQYGEILEADIPTAMAEIERKVTDNELKLIKLIRQGNPHIENIKVHQGKPTQVCITGTRGALRYKKKITFQ